MPRKKATNEMDSQPKPAGEVVAQAEGVELEPEASAVVLEAPPDEVSLLRNQLAEMRLAKDLYRGLAQQGIAEMQYIVRSHGTEYAVRRLGEMTKAFAAVKDVS